QVLRHVVFGAAERVGALHLGTEGREAAILERAERPCDSHRHRGARYAGARGVRNGTRPDDEAARITLRADIAVLRPVPLPGRELAPPEVAHCDERPPALADRAPRPAGRPVSLIEPGR